MFPDPPDAPRCVLRLAGELSSIELWASTAGFRIRTDDQSVWLLDEEPEPPKESTWLTWDEAWDALASRRWLAFRAVAIEPSIRTIVAERAGAALAHEPKVMRDRWTLP